MTNEEKQHLTPEKLDVEKTNPNSIGEILSIGKDLPTSPDKVYRSVRTDEAIDDLIISDIVRNKQSAGLVEKNRWGEKVFWSRGAEGKYHAIPEGSYVIEAPLEVAADRIVRKADVTAIYTRDENGKVVDILKEKRGKEEQEEVSRRSTDEEALAKVKRDLGIEE
ncbi:MAG: hypothetical protein WAV50_01495 [Minisyncoccia bacterium]